MTITKHRVLLFAQLAELIGKTEILMEVDAKDTVSILVAKLVQKFPDIKFLQESLIVAVDTKQLASDAKIGNIKEEIAIFPPVSGG